MDILDIILAKSLTPQGQIDSYASRARKAVSNSNIVLNNAQEAMENINTITEQTNLNNEKASDTLREAEEALAMAQELNETVTEVEVIDDNTSVAKVKKARVQKRDITNLYNIMKNYLTTGTNEDGSMTQKAITQALQNQKTELENKIKNIPSGGGSGSGNISGNISSEDAGSMVVVDENGDIIPSSITEEDIILTQIISGTYQNNDIIGLEIDYANKTFTRIQGAKNKNPGNDFNEYKMLGGRKRCIVNEDGSIVKFLTSADTLSSIENKRIMVYQPACYFMRVPISTTLTSNGIKIVKEQIYLSDTKFAGFELHPIFKDKNGNAVKYVLLPAYESGTLRANGEFVKDDAQDINFSTDKLVSIVNTKPISGYTQNFTYDAAEQMAHNNGEGWELTDLRFESLNQMLMSIEYGSMNLQNTFDLGLSRINISGTFNISSISGSTHSLLNTSGRATNTTNISNGNTIVYDEEGKCAISYRGLENPYGNIWRFIGGMEVKNCVPSFNNEVISFKMPSVPGWISAFGYDENHNWIFLPIECEGNSALPVGDYAHLTNSNDVNSGIAGGLINSQDNSGPFYYGFNITKANYHYRSDSARVMFIPTAGSTIENANYQAWINS